MTISEIITITFAIIGVASLTLKYIAPLTKNKVDDKIYKMIEEFLKIVSWDKENKVLRFFHPNTIEVKIKR